MTMFFRDAVRDPDSFDTGRHKLFSLDLTTADPVPEGLLVNLPANGGFEIVDSKTDYIRSNRDKSVGDRYSRLTYENDTGVAQLFKFLAKPDHQHNVGENFFGEYIVVIGY